MVSEWKNQLSMAINFNTSKDSDGTRTIHAKSHNVEIMMGNETNEIIKELFKSFFQKYQESLRNQWEEVNLFLIVLIHCIIILI